MTTTAQTTSRRRRRCASAVASTLLLAVSVGAAQAQDLEGQLDQKEAELGERRDQKEVLSSEIAALSEEIGQLEGEIAILRTREATVRNELEATRSRLHSARERLAGLRKRYHVAIYKQDEPDALTVILNADGFDDMIERYEYLNRIEDQDSTIIARVRDLKIETKDTVDEIEEAKAVIAAKKRELARTRSQLEAREGELESARGQKSESLEQVEGEIQHLEEGVEKLQDEVEKELQAAAEQQSATGGVPAEIPAGPVQGAGSGFIWPVNGPLTSPFGQRWGRLHAGIDIGAPDGTPIRAAKDGTIAMAQVYGGYGNYTCLNHGGGLSTCYAHQSAFKVTSGSVSQGEVIGYVGNTGASMGAHLHFEVRLNGQPVDPMGYL
jgi:murein DD-endopeptidase MepM/ murein hydrolase activator NlpD